MSSNPYHPPAAELETVGETQARKRPVRFPFAMVLRWLLGAALTGYGLLSVVSILTMWAYLADRAIINHSYSPFLWLSIEGCVLAAGVLLLARSRWVFVPALLHVPLTAWRDFGFGHLFVIGKSDYTNWAGEIGVIAFALWLLLNRRLR